MTPGGVEGAFQEGGGLLCPSAALGLGQARAATRELCPLTIRGFYSLAPVSPQGIIYTCLSACAPSGHLLQVDPCDHPTSPPVQPAGQGQMKAVLSCLGVHTLGYVYLGGSRSQTAETLTTGCRLPRPCHPLSLGVGAWRPLELDRCCRQQTVQGHLRSPQTADPVVCLHVRGRARVQGGSPECVPGLSSRLCPEKVAKQTDQAKALSWGRCCEPWAVPRGCQGEAPLSGSCISGVLQRSAPAPCRLQPLPLRWHVQGQLLS